MEVDEVCKNEANAAEANILDQDDDEVRFHKFIVVKDLLKFIDLFTLSCLYTCFCRISRTEKSHLAFFAMVHYSLDYVTTTVANSKPILLRG